MAHPQLGIAAASCLLRVVITHLRPVHPVLSWEARLALSYKDNGAPRLVSARMPTQNLLSLPPPSHTQRAAAPSRRLIPGGGGGDLGGGLGGGGWLGGGGEGAREVSARVQPEA